MGKGKRPEQKIMYDLVGAFLILYFLKEMAVVWAPTWKEGERYLSLGCFACLLGIGGVLLYLYGWMDGTARKIRALFYYYKLEGMDGYPRYLGRSTADYRWMYGKNIVLPKDKSSEEQNVLVSPLGISDSLSEFYQNNHTITRYRYSLPGGLKVSDIGGKLEGMVQHLERETILVYEDGKLNIIVGERTDRKFVQSLK